MNPVPLMSGRTLRRRCERQEMTRDSDQPLTDANSVIYSVQVPATRPARDYTSYPKVEE